MLRHFLPFVMVSFLGGVGLGSFFDFGNTFTLLLFFLALVFLLLGKIIKKHTYILLYVAISFISFSVGVWRIENATTHEYALDSFVGEYINASGVINTDPEFKETYTRLEILLTKENTKEKILIYADPFFAGRYGDVINFSGELERPSIFYNNEGKERSFNWPKYLEKENIFYEMFYPTIKIVGVSDTIILRAKRILFGIKNSFVKNLRSLLSEPEVSLLAGEVVGEKSALGETLTLSLQRTGVIHLVVLSGYNITIISESLMRGLSFIPYLSGAFSSFLGIFSIFIFVIMTGASPTAFRAAIMATLVILAQRYGRLYHGGTALLVAAFFMVLFDPKLLFFDASFELSFLATFGLIYIAPRIEERLLIIPKRFLLRQIMASTLGAQLAVLPLLIYLTGQVSIIAPITNILIVPVVPLTMFFGFLVGAFGFFSYTLAYLFSLPTAFLLSYQILVVTALDKLSFASITLF